MTNRHHRLERLLLQNQSVLVIRVKLHLLDLLDPQLVLQLMRLKPSDDVVIIRVHTVHVVVENCSVVVGELELLFIKTQICRPHEVVHTLLLHVIDAS